MRIWQQKDRRTCLVQVSPVMRLGGHRCVVCLNRNYKNRRFSTIAPDLWNKLPLELRNCASLTTFISKLKTHLFSMYFIKGIGGVQAKIHYFVSFYRFFYPLSHAFFRIKKFKIFFEIWLLEVCENWRSQCISIGGRFFQMRFSQ